MDTTPLQTIDQLEAIAASSSYQVILKHNTTCAISKGVLRKLEASEVQLPGVEKLHVLDLLTYRELSNEIASRFAVEHQSPQLLLVKDGACTYTEWGYDISAEAIQSSMENGVGRNNGPADHPR